MSLSPLPWLVREGIETRSKYLQDQCKMTYWAAFFRALDEAIDSKHRAISEALENGSTYNLPILTAELTLLLAEKVSSKRPDGADLRAPGAP